MPKQQRSAPPIPIAQLAIAPNDRLNAIVRCLPPGSGYSLGRGCQTRLGHFREAEVDAVAENRREQRDDTCDNYSYHILIKKRDTLS
jgi:hypothetical protein